MGFPASGLVWLCTAVAAQQTTVQQVWVGTWAASQQIPEAQNALPADALQDVTVREIFHLSLGGKTLRVRLSNVFGTEPLHFGGVHMARAVSPGSSVLVPGSDTAVTFSGAPEVTVPAGAEYLSDPIEFPVAALSNVAVSFYLPEAPAGQTSHPGSRQTSYLVHGNRISAADLMPEARQIDHWYEISGIDAVGPPGAAAVVALGDSITDGHATTTNGNNRWTDVLAQRLQANAATRAVGVLNEGIGGNHVLTDGLGPNALARFDRDVLGEAGARWLVVLEGINDLGRLSRDGSVPEEAHRALVHQIVAAYEQMVARAHAEGLVAIGGTITPFVGSEYYHPGAESEADRQQINRWIRTPGHFDAVVDFDQAIRDPAHPDRLLPVYDSGDHLHPSVAGYRAMAEAIPLSLFAAAR